MYNNTILDENIISYHDSVSIVLTYYNGSRFIDEQLASLSEQKNDITEVIIMDDRSISEESAILLECIRKHNLTELTSYYYNPKNLGYAKNFITGIDKAKGEYVFFCDQDDIWSPSKIRKMIDVMKQNRNINLLCCDIKPYYSDPDAPKWDSKNLKEMVDDGSVEICSDIKLNHKLRRSGCTMCVRKSFYDKVRKYWIDNWAHDDFLWKMAVYSNSCGILHKILHYRRLHSNNTSEIKVRTLQWRIEELSSMIGQHNSLKEFVLNMPNQQKLIYIEHNIEGLTQRIKFLNNKNIITWLKIAFNYFDTYTGRWKGLFLDLYLVIFGTYRR